MTSWEDYPLNAPNPTTPLRVSGGISCCIMRLHNMLMYSHHDHVSYGFRECLKTVVCRVVNQTLWAIKNIVTVNYRTVQIFGRCGYATSRNKAVTRAASGNRAPELYARYISKKLLRPTADLMQFPFYSTYKQPVNFRKRRTLSHAQPDILKSQPGEQHIKRLYTCIKRPCVSCRSCKSRVKASSRNTRVTFYLTS